MRKIFVLLLMLVAACHPKGRHAAQQAGDGGTESGGVAGDARLLAGLYRGAAGKQTNELCMLGSRGGSAHFGIVVWGANLSSCSGIGTVTRTAGGLKLVMTGDSECAILASFSGGKVVVPRSVPGGCAYYCGSGASLAGASFSRVATGRAAALKARDLVGDPLCAAR